MLGRRLSKTERAGWLAFVAILAGAVAAPQFGGPRLVVNGALGVCFLLAIPLMFLSIRGQWRGDR